MNGELVLLVVVLQDSRTFNAGNLLVLRRAHPYSVIVVETRTAFGKDRLQVRIAQAELRVCEDRDRVAIAIGETVAV